MSDGGAVLRGGFVYDPDTAAWAQRELNQMIDIAAAEIDASRDFAQRVQQVNLGQTMAGQAMRQKMIQRAGAEQGGAIWFWQSYHDRLVEFRDNLATMARATEETEARISDDQRGLHPEGTSG